MQETTRILIYLPFYSGECESRHARMHDLIQSMDALSDNLNYEFKVVADRGKASDSANIFYAKFPFLKKYTETYTVPSSGKITNAPAPIKNNAVKIKPNKKATQPAKLVDINPDTRAPKTNASNLQDEPTVNKSNDGESITSTESRIYKLVKLAFKLVKLAFKLAFRLAKRFFRYSKRSLKRLYRALKRNIRVLRRLLTSLRVKAIKVLNALEAFRTGTAHPIVWRWCRAKAISNIDKIGHIDIFHIVRPNKTSDLLLKKLRAKNPRLKLIVGPNLMAYGHPSNGFNYEDFSNLKISKVLAISSYHSTLLNEFGFSPEEISRLPPSVNPNYFYTGNRIDDTYNERCFTIIFAASQLSVEKGTLDFLNLITALDKDQRLSFKAIIIGGSKVNERVQTPVDKATWDSASKNITFAGKVSRADMCQFYQDADVFIHTGEPENGPTTIIEALTCGTPCILPGHDCFKEPEYNRGVYYYKKGNLDKVTEYIYEIADNNLGRQGESLLEHTHQDTINYISEIYRTVQNEVLG